MVFPGLLSTLWTQLVLILRPMLKWLLRKVTGKCELLRITYEDPQPGAQQTKRIEKSLQKSRTASLKQLSLAEGGSVDDAVRTIVQLKGIVVEVHTKFEDILRRCLRDIWAFNNLVTQVEVHRKEKYCKDNADHEAKLLRLWQILKPNKLLESRMSAQWGELGFQGNDPATDFRGMGVLGLDQLLYFAENYNKEASNALSKSSHPKHGFSFAIVGINITELQHRLMMKRKLRTHFYNQHSSPLSMDDYHEVYCYLMWEFTKLWFSEKPKDIMEFSRIRDKFHRRLLSQLKDPSTLLTADFQH